MSVPANVRVVPVVVNVTPSEPVDSFNCAPEDTTSTIAAGVVTPKPVLPPVKIPAYFVAAVPPTATFAPIFVPTFVPPPPAEEST